MVEVCLKSFKHRKYHEMMLSRIMMKIFAKVFDQCNSNIGISLEYKEDKKRSEEMTPNEYASMIKKIHIEQHCLEKEITLDEYHKAGKRSKY
jgi:hypothetical protein